MWELVGEKMVLASAMPEADRTALWLSYGGNLVNGISPSGWTPLQTEVDKYYQALAAGQIASTMVASNNANAAANSTSTAASALTVRAQDDLTDSSTGVSPQIALNTRRVTNALMSGFGNLTNPTGRVASQTVQQGGKPPIIVIAIAIIIAIVLLVIWRKA